MNTLMKFILFFVVAALMGVAFYVGQYQAKYEQIKAYQKQEAEQQNEIVRLKGMVEKLTEWEQAKKGFGELLASFQKGMSLKDFIPSFLIDIERLTAEQRVRMSDPSFKILTLNPGPSTAAVQPKKEEKKEEGGTAPVTSSTPPPVESASVVGAQKVAIQMTMEGRFETLIDFFQQLTDFKLNKLVTLQRLSLAPKDKLSGRAPVLTITLPMEAYMFGEGGGR